MNPMPDMISTIAGIAEAPKADLISVRTNCFVSVLYWRDWYCSKAFNLI